MMIVTFDADKLVGHQLMLAPKSQLWRRAQLELAIPYFFLHYLVREGKCWVTQTELYWEIDQLLACCAALARDDRFQLVQIALISPSWMNRHEGWQLDTIYEIWKESSDDQPVVMHYVTNDGKRYCDTPHHEAEKPLIKVLRVEGTSVRVIDPVSIQSTD